EVLDALGRLDRLRLELQAEESRAAGVEADLKGLVRKREAELERVKRRNTVLSETVSRLMTATDSDSKPVTDDGSTDTTGAGPDPITNKRDRKDPGEGA
ncbi:unnamed protein product, partial [Discosporangium mesarthrocarpum]